MCLSTSPQSNSELQSLKFPMIMHFTTIQVLMANPLAVNGSTRAYVTHFTPPPVVILTALSRVTDNLAVWCGTGHNKWLCLFCDASAPSCLTSECPSDYVVGTAGLAADLSTVDAYHEVKWIDTRWTTWGNMDHLTPRLLAKCASVQ